MFYCFIIDNLDGTITLFCYMKLRNRLSKVVSYIVQGLVVMICLDMISVESLGLGMISIESLDLDMISIESLDLDSLNKDISICLDSRDH